MSDKPANLPRFSEHDRILIRLRLIALFFGIAFFFISLVLFVYQWKSDREKIFAKENETAKRSIGLVAYSHDQILESTEQFLENIAVRGGTVFANQETCEKYLLELLKINSWYANVGYISRSKNLICSASSSRSLYTQAYLTIFEKTLLSEGFTVGDYTVDKSDNRPSAVIGYPYLNEEGIVEGVIFAVYNFGLERQFISTVNVSGQNIFFLVNPNGTILTGNPPELNLTGNTIKNSRLFEQITTIQTGQSLDTIIDGQPRIFIFGPLSRTSHDQAFVVVGFDVQSLYQSVDQNFILKLLYLGGVLLLVGVAYFSLEKFQKNYHRAVLSETMAKRDAVLQSIGDGIVVTDSEGRIIMLNHAAEELLGVIEREVLEKAIIDVVKISDEKGNLVPKESRPVKIALGEGKSTRGVYYYNRPDGTRFPATATVTPIVLNEAIIGSVRVIHDITREKEIDQMKTEFISLASHQLRTPLTSINWFSEMLIAGDAGALNTEQVDFINNIHTSTQRMIDLVNSLLNISRIESGRLRVDPKPTNLREIVDKVLFELKPRISAKKQHIVVHSENSLPPIMIDPKLISQVYLNLISNAVKYTHEEGDISISIYQKEDAIISQITDCGYGIPKADHSKIFTKFFRSINISKYEPDGTGLGLYLVKAIIDLSGGTIWFESDENIGTTFWFSLPVSGSEAKPGEVTVT